MNSVNQNLNNYDIYGQQVGFKANTAAEMLLPDQHQAAAVQNVQLPDIYYMPENYKKPLGFKEKLKKVDLMNLIVPWFEHPLLMLGTCAGISFGVDAFDRSCNKEYSKSVLGKAAKFGDKIEQSKIIQSNPSQKILGGINKGWAGIKKFFMKNSMVKAMVETPSAPEWSMPKHELKHSNYHIVTRFKELAGEVGLSPEAGLDPQISPKIKFMYAKDLNLDKSEIEYLKKLYPGKKISQIEHREVVNRITLRRLGKTESEITSIIANKDASHRVARELFLKSGLTPAEFEMIMKDETGASIGLVKKASENLKKIRVNSGKFILPGSHQPFANVSDFEGIFNRAHSMSEGAATKTGRFMSKLLQKIHRGFTFGGGKLGVMIFVGPILVETMLNTVKADRREKVGTLSAGLINAMSWVFTFPLIARAIYALGGVQYAGMGPEQVEKYNDLINKFNKLAKEGKFENYNKYKEAKHELKKALREMRQVKNQSLFTKTCRGISRFFKRDLMKIESYRNKNAFGNAVRRIPNFLKDAVHGPGRFLVFMLVGIPLVDKVITKCTSAIFGRSYDQYKADEQIANKEKQEEFTMNDLRSRLLEVQRKKLYPESETTSAPKGSISENFAKLNGAAAPKIMETMAQEAEYKKQLDIPSEEIEQAQNIDDPSEIKPLIQEQTEPVQEQMQLVQEQTQPVQEQMEPVQEQIQPVREQMEPVQEQMQPVQEQPVPINETNALQPAQPQALEQPAQAQLIQQPLPQALNNQKRDNYTYIPSQENVLNKIKPEEQINKYIPSQMGIQINKTFDNSGLDAALRRADRAEKRAINTLAGNFGNS